MIYFIYMLWLILSALFPLLPVVTFLWLGIARASSSSALALRNVHQSSTPLHSFFTMKK